MTDEALPPSFHQRSRLWWPAETQRVDAEYDYMLKRVTDVDAASKRCRRKWLAVQAGGNVGMWPLRIAKQFDLVHTFEPVPYYFEALSRNVAGVPNIIAHNQLLSDRTDNVVPFSMRGDGRSRVVSRSEANAEFSTTTIDALDLTGCDAIFLDVEGHELAALHGAMATIKRFRPVITIEYWEKNEPNLSQFFVTNDYVIAAKVHGDRIYVPR